MRGSGVIARGLGTALGRIAILVSAAALSAGGQLAAAEFPQAVSFSGEVLDGAGQPLAGTYLMTFRYLDPAGRELYAESIAAVEVAAGRFQVQLGTGSVHEAAAYGSLEATFAGHPRVELEVAVAGTVYEPRLGILPAGHSLKSRLVAAGQRAEDDDQEHWRGYEAPGGATAVQSGILAPRGTRPQPPVAAGTVWSRPFTLPVVGPSLSRPVRDLPLAQERPMEADSREVNRPRHESLFDGQGRRFGTTTEKVDDFLAGPSRSALATPALTVDFEGINNISGVLPPDTEGAVGPNHYVQVVNLAFAVYTKSGTLLAGPFNTNSLWAGFGGPCQTDNSGDAIFFYDQQADRFVLSQFAVAAGHQSVCFAVSQTPDPTGAFFRYEVVTPRFPDYYKVGTWPAANNNAYFFGTNSGFQGQYDAFAMDRASMLAGAPARPMQFFQNFPNLMMPADLDGPVGPAADRPGLFYHFRDGGEPYFFNPPADSLDIYEFDVDWNTPSNTTLTLATSLTPAQGLAPFNWTVCGFFVSNCIPQPGTAQGIDSASWWPMQRLVYRNFGSYEALAGTWTVDVNSTGNRAAPRWFELRNVGAGWSLFQQGTHSPDAIHRWMGSLAMDGAGNIALGYSRGDGGNFASIYYATRETTDPLDTLQAEALLWAGTGSQTHSAARWGDYSSMEVDPADDCTFWFTTEYLATTGSAPWRTHVGAFRLPSCGGPINNPPAVTITSPANGSSFGIGTPVGFAGSATDVEDGSLTASLSWSSSRDGVIGSGGSFTTSSLSGGTHTITASVTDSGGRTGSASIGITITVPTAERLHEDFEGGLGGWTASGLWHLAINSSCASPGYSSPVNSAYYGQDATCNYATAAANTGDLVSPPVSGINASSALSFDFFRQVEFFTGGSFDQTQVAVSVAGSGVWTTVWSRDSTTASSGVWESSGAIPIGSFAGSDVQLRFRFSTVDNVSNAFVGWLVDEVVVTGDVGANTPPTVTITAPPDPSTFNQGTSVTFTGTATDAEDGNLAAGLAWTSNLDGAIGSGASFSTTALSVGTHTVTASVTDSGGLPGSDAVAVTIDAVGAGADLWMSFKTSATIPGVGTAADEDIVSFDESTGQWALEFDGSDVGLGSFEIGGLAVLPSGNLLLSFTTAGTVGGIAVDDSDVVEFTPTSLGATTAGTFALYFDGSDVGLAATSESIDAIALAADGRLILSVTGNISANGASGVDEDLWIFTGTLGTATSGSFALFFDGSDVGLNTAASEDLDAAALTAGGELLFSTVGAFTVTGATGDGMDVGEFAGTFGTTTSGTFSLRHDLSALGIDPSENVGALHLVE